MNGTIIKANIIQNTQRPVTSIKQAKGSEEQKQLKDVTITRPAITHRKVVKAKPVSAGGSPRLLSIQDIQKKYLPYLSIRKIREIAKNNVHTIMFGNKYFVDESQMEELLNNPQTKAL